MATSESDSEVDFESADEGDMVSHTQQKSAAVQPEDPKRTVEAEKVEKPKTENLKPVSKSKLIYRPPPQVQKEESKDSSKISKVVSEMIQSSEDCIQEKEDKIESDKKIYTSKEKPKSLRKEETKHVRLEKEVNVVKSDLKDIPNVPKEKSTKTLEESKSRAKSEEKPEKDADVKVERKLSNPIAGKKVMLHIEKKAMEKNLTAKTQNQLTEKEVSVLDRLSSQKDEKKTSPGWGGLGNWGTSFISSAASSVSTFTSHVTQGIETVLESVEASLGAPTPEELAVTLTKKEENETETKTSPLKQDSPESPSPKVIESHDGILPGSLMGGVSALTRAFESTSSKVITGGLDTLELIGKKTMDILTEGDPGLRNKRNIFSGDKTTLSQVLREARNRLESTSMNDQNYEDPFPIHYSKLFDEFQGLVHLEALEMLSSQSKTKLQDVVLMLETDSCDILVETMEEIRTLCEDLPPTDDTPDEEANQDFNKLLTEHVCSLPFKLNVDKIKTVQLEAKDWLKNCIDEQEKREVVDSKEIYIKAITSLAKLSACMMELYHKISELLLVAAPPLPELHKYCKHLTSLTAVLCLEIGILTSSFCRCLNTAADDSDDPDSVNPLITNVYLEASNSNSYIQDAFSLLIPVLQEIASNSIES